MASHVAPRTGSGELLRVGCRRGSRCRGGAWKRRRAREGCVRRIAGFPSEAQAVLDFEFYRESVEPIFLRGHGAGGLVPVSCVISWQVGTPFKLQPLQHDAGGDPYWTEARSLHNFEVVSRLVTPGLPLSSRLLRKPLATDAGGTEYHVGGKFWESQDDPEWQELAAWVRGENRGSTCPAPLQF